MRILIAGNLGYVGPAVIEQLRQSYPAATLLGYDIGYFAHCLTQTPPLPEAKLGAQFFGDVRHFPAEFLRGVNVLVNLAAISNDPMGNAYEQVTLDINYRAGVALAKAAKAAGVGCFVFASSCSVYGTAEDGARSETSRTDPLTAYARSKVFTEGELEPLASPGFKVTCLRFATACGMSPRLRLDLVLNDFVASAIATKHIQILSDGSPWRPLIHVKDMARAVDWAIARKPETGGNFLIANIGSDSWNYQVRQLAEAVAGQIPGTSVSINQAAAPDKRSYRVDFGRFALLAPAYQPEVTLETAIQDLQAGLTALGFADANFRQSHLMRLNALAALRRNQLLTEDLRWNSRV